MKNNNKHPHHDLIVELIGDTSKQVEMITGSNSVVYVEAPNVIADTEGLYKFRIKPREFIKGHWYPCLFEGREFICYYTGEFLKEPINSNHRVSSIIWDCPSTYGMIVGKSLGKIEFGGE